ncbi:MAG: hypothetical protein CL670_10135 [Balneola sp.]|jgi:hypothetical protein|nr:hypothetical protein [Balneola sp.]MBE79501.1 hypothetical protein [Balneola sp.]|tara:strand:- start:642 stop:1202 length:561 start_codon:yes stop_codon:yes gene_type:complete
MNKDNTFEYNSLNYKEFMKKFRNMDSSQHSLIVYAGAFTTNREASIDELKREVIGEAVEIDLAEIVTPYEEESYKNLDECFAAISDDAPLVVFRNAEQLNGVYTGFSSSIVKYASPQEKYFLRNVKKVKAPVVMEFKDLDQLDRMAQRTADAVVLFKSPSSLIEKLAWKVQNLHVHGSNFLSSRPN